MAANHQEPIGVVLAGGRGKRFGGAKATALLAGKPLFRYPLAALAQALGEVAVVTKPGTELTQQQGLEVWVEEEPRHHPLFGIVEALARADGRAVLVCAVDLPLVSSRFLKHLVEVATSAPATIAQGPAGIQPLLGLYRPGVADPLRTAAENGASVREAVMALGPRLLAVDDPEMLLNVNTAAELERAEAIVQRRGRSA